LTSDGAKPSRSMLAAIDGTAAAVAPSMTIAPASPAINSTVTPQVPMS
jgi:hypothetical protein